MEFYYYKSDKNIASFGIYVSSSGYNQKLWLTTDSTNDGWTKAAVGLYRRTEKFTVMFEGSQLIADGYTQLAIDDISFKNWCIV